jgi:hypothetical protein
LYLEAAVGVFSIARIYHTTLGLKKTAPTVLIAKPTWSRLVAASVVSVSDP